ncbi:hypothetical protein EMIT0P4_260034 [Pseudomonas sp. IT-P4]
MPQHSRPGGCLIFLLETDSFSHFLPDFLSWLTATQAIAYKTLRHRRSPLAQAFRRFFGHE